MNLDKLSPNIISLINEVLRNQELVNYIGHDGNNPSKNTVNPSSIAPKGINERVLPYPFDVEFKESERTQLHIYYPNINFVNNANAGRVVVLFEIVVHKNLWLLTDNNKKIIRPYHILNCIMKSMNDKNIEGLGKIHFIEATHVSVNSEYEGIRLVATFTEF